MNGIGKMKDLKNRKNDERSEAWTRCARELRYVNEAPASLDGLRFYMPSAFRVAIEKVGCEIWILATTRRGIIDCMPEIVWDEYLELSRANDFSRKEGQIACDPPMKYFVDQPTRTRWTIPSALSAFSKMCGNIETVHLLPEEAFIGIWSADRRQKGLSGG